MAKVRVRGPRATWENPDKLPHALSIGHFNKCGIPICDDGSNRQRRLTGTEKTFLRELAAAVSMEIVRQEQLEGDKGYGIPAEWVQAVKDANEDESQSRVTGTDADAETHSQKRKRGRETDISYYARRDRDARRQAEKEPKELKALQELKDIINRYWPATITVELGRITRSLNELTGKIAYHIEEIKRSGESTRMDRINAMRFVQEARKLFEAVIRDDAKATGGPVTPPSGGRAMDAIEKIGLLEQEFGIGTDAKRPAEQPIPEQQALLAKALKATGEFRHPLQTVESSNMLVQLRAFAEVIEKLDAELGANAKRHDMPYHLPFNELRWHIAECLNPQNRRPNESINPRQVLGFFGRFEGIVGQTGHQSDGVTERAMEEAIGTARQLRKFWLGEERSTRFENTARQAREHLNTLLWLSCRLEELDSQRGFVNFGTLREGITEYLEEWQKPADKPPVPAVIHSFFEDFERIASQMARDVEAEKSAAAEDAIGYARPLQEFWASQAETAELTRTRGMSPGLEVAAGDLELLGTVYGRLKPRLSALGEPNTSNLTATLGVKEEVIEKEKKRYKTSGQQALKQSYIEAYDRYDDAINLLGELAEKCYGTALPAAEVQELAAQLMPLRDYWHGVCALNQVL